MMQVGRLQALSKLSKLRDGASLSEASELLAPEAWETYRDNYCPVWILGDPESNRRQMASAAALTELMQLILHLGLEQKLALEVLDPPGSPMARWVSLSADVLGTLETEDLDIEDSKVKLPDGPKREVRVFQPDEPDPAAEIPFDADPLDGSHELPKLPAKVRVPRAWQRLPKETQSLVKSHGGKRKVAVIVKKMLPNLSLGTIERELRRLWAVSPP